jgi:phosphoribosylanthranilate isomerase
MIELGVTITGADDNVEPSILDEIGREYPLVEWGILFSKSSEGQPRYPTPSWREKMYWATIERGEYYTLAAHLCGKSVDAFLASYEFFENEVTMGFNAIQFNKLTAENKDQIFTFAKIQGHRHDVIVQYNQYTDVILNGLFDEDVPEDLKLLFDASGGKGMSYKETGGWPNIPEPFASRVSYGFAGGLNRDNIEQAAYEVLQMHKDQEGFVWLDLESGARTEDKFDIDKVIDILDTVTNVINTEN